MTETTAAAQAAAAPETSTAEISVRFFAAAAEAAGAEELHLQVPADGVAVVALLTDLPRLVREQQSAAAHREEPQGDDDAASLERVCARSSFLINGVRTRAETAWLRPGDQLDVLPPFAGG
jgi:molybdopterin synthase sulfur carrier subunit